MYDFYFRCRKKNKFRSFSPLLASFVKMQTIGKFFKEAKRQDESLYTVFSKLCIYKDTSCSQNRDQIQN
ncbi:hypothetical protein CAPSP0001_1541 [Capnocytophaga sputigena ATCC 33612]|uniref:Uncharacterized protein n=1 Tax=Capnocytophaga sputigena TaxID=1019 RepID=A0ABM6MGS9_CAPSP|nr:hypothetical protein CGC55_00690 [Capnocytophaga sputigena]EEB66530.1 hypothetical protein CAPSP0001_1541 [Capnocytophaga sputigena ATCC 33612]